jgi:hypothetical protein
MNAFCSSRREENTNSKTEQHEANELKNDRRLEQEKRHRAAALHDAGAKYCAPLLPRGCGVRQPYAAFVTPNGDDFSAHWPPTSAVTMVSRG